MFFKKVEVDKAKTSKFVPTNTEEGREPEDMISYLNEFASKMEVKTDDGQTFKSYFIKIVEDDWFMFYQRISKDDTHREVNRHKLASKSIGESVSFSEIQSNTNKIKIPIKQVSEIKIVSWTRFYPRGV